MRAQYKELALAPRRKYLQVELRPRIRQFFPSSSDFSRLLRYADLSGPAENDRMGLQPFGCAQNAAPYFIGRNNGQVNCLPSLLRNGERLRKEKLFHAAKKLL